MTLWRLIGTVLLALASAGQAWAQGPAPAERVAWTTADVDGDRDAERVSVDTRWWSAPVGIEHGPEAAATAQVPPRASLTTARLFARDLDADRDLDLVLADGFGTTLAVWLNSGDGRFTAAPVHRQAAPVHDATVTRAVDAPSTAVAVTPAPLFADAPDARRIPAEHAVATAWPSTPAVDTARHHTASVRGPPR